MVQGFSAKPRKNSKKACVLCSRWMGRVPRRRASALGRWRCAIVWMGKGEIPPSPSPPPSLPRPGSPNSQQRCRQQDGEEAVRCRHACGVFAVFAGFVETLCLAWTFRTPERGGVCVLRRTLLSPVRRTRKGPPSGCGQWPCQCRVFLHPVACLICSATLLVPNLFSVCSASLSLRNGFRLPASPSATRGQVAVAVFVRRCAPNRKLARQGVVRSGPRTCPISWCPASPLAPPWQSSFVAALRTESWLAKA